MPQQAMQTTQAATLWVLVADGGHAQIYDCQKSIQQLPLGGANKNHLSDEKPGHALMPVENGAMKADSIDGYEIGHDRRGTASSSNSPTHNTYEPHGDTGSELEKRFIKSIASKLQQASAEKLFYHLVLVAPGRMINELKAHFNAELNGQIAGTLAKDLTHMQTEEIVKHLHDTLAQAHIA